MAEYANVNGVRTWYAERGQGEPLVLLHGGSAMRGISRGTSTGWPRVSGSFRRSAAVMGTPQTWTGPSPST
jgi:pimeloyl-ACP methyl ester carboxylesterase